MKWDSRLRGNDDRACFYDCIKIPVILFILFLSFPCLAAEPQPAAKLADIEDALVDQQQTARELAAQEKLTNQNLRELQQNLIRATTELERKQGDAEDLEESLTSLKQDIATHQKQLTADRKIMADLASALLRLRREAPEIALIDPETGKNDDQRRVLLAATLRQLQAKQQAVEMALEESKRLEAEAKSQQQRLADTERKLSAQQNNLESMIYQRQSKLKQTAAQKAAAEKQQAALAAEAKDLRQLLEKISQRPGKLGKPAVSTLPAGWQIPVQGRIIRGYGGKDEYGVASEGLLLQARAKSPIVAPRAGKVAFTGPFKGYGNIVILQHEGDYHSFLAGFGEIKVVMGQKLAAGEPLGLMPDKNPTRPELYFELRRKGSAIDPFANQLPQKISRR